PGLLIWVCLPACWTVRPRESTQRLSCQCLHSPGRTFRGSDSQQREQFSRHLTGNQTQSQSGKLPRD
uniref:Uncharacterized protein n=1 Tax=Chrysemys picta bellii TaxID=8478 RepID=A0A8C3FAV7_CHRPI